MNIDELENLLEQALNQIKKLEDALLRISLDPEHAVEIAIEAMQINNLRSKDEEAGP